MDLVKTETTKPITAYGKALGWDYIKIETFKTYVDGKLASEYDVCYYMSNNNNYHKYKTIWKVVKGVDLQK